MSARRFLAAIGMVAAASTMQAQTATQDVTIQVNAISRIAVTGGAQSLTITTATAGSEPTAATATVNWAITTNQTNQKVTASLDAALPANVTLSVNMAQPTGATSAGSQALGTTAVDLVTGISTLAQGGLGLTYTLAATAAAGVVASTTRTVTYTITAGI